ncbi:hypothetical protein [Noviherbaspirillum aerium]|uniref:hypothetical protein n=1 Tax=Noviherbaspirillum aerium TaxID=2588497 RepID=UPI00124F2B9D|nr:hypothetical protein [Noviherbaspirillum aerium]
MQETSKPRPSGPVPDRPAPGSLEDLNLTAPATADAAGEAEAGGEQGQPEQDANNRDRHGLENQSVTKPAPIDVERRQ